MSEQTPASPTGWHTRRMVAFDTETTGTDQEAARLVSAAVIELGGGQPVVHRTWLVDPGVEIPAEATAIHGITTERVRAEGRVAAEAVEEITEALAALLVAGVPVVSYNAVYDLTVLDREARRHGVTPLADRCADGICPVIDPLVIDRAIDRYRKGSRTLAAVCEHYQVRQEDAHDASGDALAAARLAWKLAHRDPELAAVEPRELHERQVGWHRAWAEDFERFLRRRDPAAAIDGTWPHRPPANG